MRRLLPAAMLLAAPAMPAAAQSVVKVATVDAPDLPGFRERLQSALLEGGMRLSTTTDGRDMPRPTLVVSAKVQPQDMSAGTSSGTGYCIGGTRLAGSADLRMRDAQSGAVIWGGIVTRSVTLGSSIRAGQGVGEGDCGTATPDSPSFGALTTALALSAARRIAFQIRPLRVAAIDGSTLVLDHGGALVPLGALVQVAGASGIPVTYRVTASMPASAIASPYGTPGAITAGAVARVIEDDDPAASGRRFSKVGLP